MRRQEELGARQIETVIRAEETRQRAARCVCACVCARACVCACIRVRVCLCACKPSVAPRKVAKAISGVCHTPHCPVARTLRQ